MGLGIWVSLLLLLPIVCCSACLVEERNSLLDFRQGINFTYYRGFQLPLESWRGEIREGIFQLLYLEYLDLSGNSFNPLSIPPQVGELRRLKHLSLSYCGFSGQIPRELSKLQQLELLDLSYNHLDGVIPREVGNMSTLKFLDLSIWLNDDLQSGNMGEWIKHLRGLEHLGLSDMNLTMEGDIWLGIIASLANLTKLSMDNCGLSGEIPPSFANLSGLQWLDLSRNSLRGKIPVCLGALPLSNLFLSYNNLEGPLPSSLGGLSKVQYLDLSSNKLNGSIPPTLGNMKKTMKIQRMIYGGIWGWQQAV
ncbi:hypothetical protein SUGI_0199710 [Cryptomeria japonica]|nr:hypothetical protein SUGI_0199710 [Cryptomeria japonica]